MGRIPEATVGGRRLRCEATSWCRTKPSAELLWRPKCARCSRTEGEARAIATERLDAALRWFGSIGATATGEVADEHPLYAIRDALRDRPIDEIIISTLPPGMSKWLRQDLPRKTRREFGVPVTHVVGEAPSRTKSA